MDPNTNTLPGERTWPAEPPNEVLISTWCPDCDRRTRHISREEHTPHGDLDEWLTCTECGTIRAVKIL